MGTHLGNVWSHLAQTRIGSGFSGSKFFQIVSRGSFGVTHECKQDHEQMRSSPDRSGSKQFRNSPEGMLKRQSKHAQTGPKARQNARQGHEPQKVSTPKAAQKDAQSTRNQHGRKARTRAKPRPKPAQNGHPRDPPRPVLSSISATTPHRSPAQRDHPTPRATGPVHLRDRPHRTPPKAGEYPQGQVPARRRSPAHAATAQYPSNPTFHLAH